MTIIPSLTLPGMRINTIDSTCSIKMPMIFTFYDDILVQTKGNLVSPAVVDFNNFTKIAHGSIMEAYENSRAKFYKTIEQTLGSFGKSCLQRAICEVAQVPFIGPHTGLFGEIIDLLLTFSVLKPGKHGKLSEYLTAEQFGRENSRMKDSANKYESDTIDSSTEIILARLSRAMAELAALKSQNEELRNLIQSFIPLKLKSDDDSSIRRSIESSEHNLGLTNISLDFQYEFSRRKLINDINELWNFVRSESKPDVKSFVKELKNSLFYDLDVISKRDENLRCKQLEKLSNYIQNHIHQLQNPQNCTSARKLVCTLNKGCGFGCQIHHLAYCMVVALATKRTLILNSQNWHYANKIYGLSLWDLAFKPLSHTCLDDYGLSRINWLSGGNNHQNIQVVDLPILDSLRPRPLYLPLTIPEEISFQLVTLHGAPFVWFIGQILNYIMKPSNDIEEYLREKKAKFGFKSPIVGLHVRRTDKINTEASFHLLSEYMVHIEDYYDRLDIFKKRQNDEKTLERLIYLATDDFAVWKKEIQIYEKKGYKFIGDSEISNTASVDRRYSFDSLKNIILDIWLLSETDFLVCTFSSQVCRLAYELMQSKNPGVDKSADFFSLDDIYYFGGQNSHNQIAILDHKAKADSEIDLKRGDIIGVAGNHWNGYSKGLNRVTQQSGLYPGFKTKEKIEMASFELFKDSKN